jgi:hypothetical protein
MELVESVKKELKVKQQGSFKFFISFRAKESTK